MQDLSGGAVGRSLGGLFIATLVAPEVHQNLDGLGLRQRERYFGGRAAPLGAASPALVISTFYNFSRRAVEHSVPSVWHKASPEQVLSAQLQGVDAALARAFVELPDGLVVEAADLVRRAAENAAAVPEGRPLFSAWADQPWPTSAHLILWHGFYLLREFRGDGHIAVLTAEGIRGIEALALQIALTPAIDHMMRRSRQWTDDEWSMCLVKLRADGWLTDSEVPTLTAEGARRRADIEARTDNAEAAGYPSLGADDGQRLIELAGPITEALSAAGLTRFPG
jgi:hypothetical protein